jgi:hypothetical protein
VLDDAVQPRDGGLVSESGDPAARTGLGCLLRAVSSGRAFHQGRGCVDSGFVSKSVGSPFLTVVGPGVRDALCAPPSPLQSRFWPRLRLAVAEGIATAARRSARSRPTLRSGRRQLSSSSPISPTAGELLRLPTTQLAGKSSASASGRLLRPHTHRRCELEGFRERRQCAGQLGRPRGRTTLLPSANRRLFCWAAMSVSKRKEDHRQACHDRCLISAPGNRNVDLAEAMAAVLERHANEDQASDEAGALPARAPAAAAG